MILVYMTRDMHYRPYEEDILNKYFGKVITIKFPNGFNPIVACDVLKKHKPNCVLWKLDCEKTKTKEWEEMVALSKRINRPQINNPVAWINCNLKEKCFEVWKENGIDIPEYEIVKDTIDPKWYPCIIKVNNNCGGMNTIFMNDENDANKLNGFMADYETRKNKYTNTKVLCVRYVDFRTKYRYVPVYRAIVAGGKLVGGMVRLYDNDPSLCFKAILCTNDKIKDKTGMNKRRTKCLIKYYKRLDQMFANNGDYFIRAAKATGLDSVAMDFLDADGKFIMLEAQSDFEMKEQVKSPKTKLFRLWFENNKELFKKEIPLYVLWMDKERLTKKIYKRISDDISNKRKAH